MAKRLYGDLQRAGVSPWLDRKKLLPGQDWKREVKLAMQHSSHILILLSEHSVSKNGYVQKELREALDLLDHMPPSTILIPARLDDCEPAHERLQDLHWVDLFDSYDEEFDRILRVLLPDRNEVAAVREEFAVETGEEWKEPEPPVSEPQESVQSRNIERSTLPQQSKASQVIVLRSVPQSLSRDEVDEARRKYRGIQHDFEDQGDVVIDHATGLMWQKAGSDSSLTYDKAVDYVKRLNQEQLAGFDNWRLPTIPELVSLLEAEEKNGDVYIDPVFDAKQQWCWSADKRSGSSGSAWYVSFNLGDVYWDLLHNLRYVRCVRS